MKLALSTDFFTAFARLPKKLFGKTNNLLENLKKNPDYIHSKGANLEKLKNSDDLYSLRVGDDYRCILKKPEKGDVFILLWIDHHDEAYNWANNHSCVIHPETGTLQILNTTHIEAVVSNEATSQNEAAFFSQYRDRELLRLGVPESLLAKVKTVNSETELDAIRDILPDEAYEGLYYLLCGDTLAEVYEYFATKDSAIQKIDTEDFGAALANDSSKRNFYVVEEDDDLASMLNSPLDKWRVFLHPTQRKIVEKSRNGPVRVLGGAGTGKTVVAMHRAKWLASKLSENSQKILFTTFTKNLAIDILENLKKICSDKVLEKIEVKNLDSWVYEFLYKNGYKEKIVYDNQSREIWENALLVKSPELDLPATFFFEEWARVVQPQNISSLDEYIRAKRTGRGTSLSRTQRKLAWEVFEEYRLLLAKGDLKEPAEAMRDARLLIESGKAQAQYAAIIVDEAQDMNEQAFCLIRSLVSEGANDIFIVGDAHQRIYGHKVVLGQCGIKIVGRSKKLKLNYRTSDEVRKFASKIFGDHKVDDLDDGQDENRGYKSLYHGPEPEIFKCSDLYSEVEQIEKVLKKLQQEDPESRICVVSRTKKLVEDYCKLIGQKGFETVTLTSTTSDNSNSTKIRFATMHRVKGLDFDHVIIAGANSGNMPLKSINQTDELLIKEENLMHERALLFVAATRAKKNLFITGYGQMSEFINTKI